MPTPQTFHPEIDALFDEAQESAVAVSFSGKEHVLLSQKHFDLMLVATASTAGDIKHVPVTRLDKPITYILQRETFDNLADIHQDLLYMIRQERSIRTP